MSSEGSTRYPGVIIELLLYFLKKVHRTSDERERDRQRKRQTEKETDREREREFIVHLTRERERD